MRTSRQARAGFFGIYLTVFATCAISPFSRGVWWAENTPILLIAALVAVVGRWHAFSPTAFGSMLVLLGSHTIGGHDTFGRVPLELVTDRVGALRDHFDRVARFSVGFPAWGIAVLGSKGDIWDAQKDMLADGLGAVVATVFFAVGHRGACRNA